MDERIEMPQKTSVRGGLQRLLGSKWRRRGGSVPPGRRSTVIRAASSGGVRSARARWAPVIVLLSVGITAAACSSSTTTSSSKAVPSSKVVNVGFAGVLSGSVAELGLTTVDGLKMAIENLNQHGGLLGHHIHLVVANGEASPSISLSEVRNMVLNDHIVADFGAVSSASGAAEESFTSAHHIPFFAAADNDVSLMTTHFNKWSFQLVPNTYMEPRAVAYYVHLLYGSKPIRVATITPDYSFGLSDVTQFLAGLREYDVNFTLVSRQAPPLNAPNYDPNIVAILAAHPNFVFSGQYGGDLVTLTKQALSYGLLKKVKFAALYGEDELAELGPSDPEAGAIGFDRAAFWAKTMAPSKAWVSRYHSMYGQWPSQWAILAYTAVQAWAYAVKKAGTFNGTKVASELPGATVPTIRGPITIRACDHQALVPEYVGTISSHVDPTYGFPIYKHIIAVPASKIIDPCGYRP